MEAGSSQSGFKLYIVVESVAPWLTPSWRTEAKPIGAGAPEITARFRHPGRNMIDLF
jgi:hypothetical protein